MPQALQDKPEYFEDLSYIVDAFNILSCSRADSFSYIPLTEIKAYCDLYGIDDVEEFVFLLRKMDHAFVDENVNQHKAKLKNGNRNS